MTTTVRSFLALSLGAAAALLVACSGSDSGGVPTVADAAIDPSVPDDGGRSPGSDAGGSPKDAGGDASDASAAADAGDRRIDPIAEGRSWTYDVTILGFYPLCSAGSQTGRVVGTSTIGGKTSFDTQSLCPQAGVVHYAVDGDKVELHDGFSWRLSLDSPVTEGHRWSDGIYSYEWKSMGTLTTAAGTFDECWKARSVDRESYTTFCRGVGPVRWHYVDDLGNGYDALLTSYTR